MYIYIFYICVYICTHSLELQSQVVVGMPTVIVCAVGIAFAMHWYVLVAFGIWAVLTRRLWVLVLPLM